MAHSAAFDWIIETLEHHHIPYLICGGLAAIAYGAKRPLNDIDLYIPHRHYATVINSGRAFISWGPAQFTDQHWRVHYVQFHVAGQKIEVGTDRDLQIYDSHRKQWQSQILNFNHYDRHCLFDRTVSVMKKHQLIAYKQQLNRKVDQIDIAQISQPNDPLA